MASLAIRRSGERLQRHDYSIQEKNNPLSCLLAGYIFFIFLIFYLNVEPLETFLYMTSP